jgi:hypothetical protein
LPFCRTWPRAAAITVSGAVVETATATVTGRAG